MHHNQHAWAKEFDENILTICANDKLYVQSSVEIKFEEVPLPWKKSLQIFIRKHIYMENYKVYARLYHLKTIKGGGHLDCKACFIDDYLIGIAVQPIGLQTQEIVSTKRAFAKHYPNYEIVWQ